MYAFETEPRAISKFFARQSRVQAYPFDVNVHSNRQPTENSHISL